MNGKQLIKDVFDQEKVQTIPVGFWFHFLTGKDLCLGYKRPSLINKSIEGHKDFFNTFHPDILKIMTDGFFVPPSILNKRIDHVEDLTQIQELGIRHPWIENQIKFAKKIVQFVGDSAAVFYNIFSPANILRQKFELIDNDANKLSRIFLEDPLIFNALKTISKDIDHLVEGVIKSAGSDGIYFCVQNILDKKVTKEIYRKYITPSEQHILKTANRFSKYNILHICSYNQVYNDLTFYQDYDIKAVNYAVHTEDITLAQGKTIFPGKAIIGGFQNDKRGVLYLGNQYQIEHETERLLKLEDTKGIILGADCTVPMDISLKHLEWARNKARYLVV